MAAEPLFISTPDSEPRQNVRPKVLRRPAQFAGAEKPIETLPALIKPEAEETTNPITHKPWQDDARFGVALLAIVIAVNLAVTFWLAMIDRHNPKLVQQETTHQSSRITNTVVTTSFADGVHVLDSLSNAKTTN